MAEGGARPESQHLPPCVSPYLYLHEATARGRGSQPRRLVTGLLLLAYGIWACRLPVGAHRRLLYTTQDSGVLIDSLASRFCFCGLRNSKAAADLVACRSSSSALQAPQASGRVAPLGAGCISWWVAMRSFGSTQCTQPVKSAARNTARRVRFFSPSAAYWLVAFSS
jgi:hypothetical protein